MIRQMPEKIQQTMIGRTPLGRMGQPEDVANAYAWLASRPGIVHHGHGARRGWRRGYGNVV